MNEVKAYERVYERYYRRVLAAAEERVGSDGAPDVASEVFLVLWRRWAELGDRHALLPWLQRACAGVAANQVRRLRREARLRNLLESLPEADVPADVADLVYERATLLAAWESLRPPDREILTIHVLPDHDCSTQCVSSTSRSRLSRARARLANALREYDNDSSTHSAAKTPTDSPTRVRGPDAPEYHGAGSPLPLGEDHHVRRKER